MIRIPKKRRKAYRPGDEKRCARCGEQWPLTLEFFRMQTVKGIPYGWHSYCRACESEWRAEKGFSHKKGEGAKCRGRDATTDAVNTAASSAVSVQALDGGN